MSRPPHLYIDEVERCDKDHFRDPEGAWIEYADAEIIAWDAVHARTREIVEWLEGFVADFADGYRREHAEYAALKIRQRYPDAFTAPDGGE